MCYEDTVADAARVIVILFIGQIKLKYLLFLQNSSPGRAGSPGSTRSSARSAPAPGKRQGPDVSANRGGVHCQKNAPAWKLKIFT